MLKRLISWLPESRGEEFAKELIKEHPGMSIFSAAGGYSGVDDFVADYFGARIKPYSKTFLITARLVDGELHARGVLKLRRESSRFSKVPKAKFDSMYLGLHHYVSAFELCETVVSQCWGRIGKARLEWIKSDERIRTDRFGVDSEFLRLFVEGNEPLYEQAEQIAGDFSGVILRVNEPH